MVDDDSDEDYGAEHASDLETDRVFQDNDVEDIGPAHVHR